ncbi:MAG TPA: phosphate-starvation-inducible PsiE family protein [Ktedonobacteraceae bacterium]|nr:phosphate-starvation-inducible PsiE family protein [Ktedonobacteraceae bacterium]
MGQEDNISPPETLHSQHNRSTHQSRERFVQNLGRLLDRADSVVYAIVGICFLLAAILALVYTFWAFSLSIIGLQTFPMNQRPGQEAQAIIELVSGLLLVLIIMEMLGTVIHYLQVHATSLKPFLFIGIISATRSILSIGARLSIQGFNLSATDFMHAMIELGVSAAVILALGLTLKLLSKLFEDSESR